MKSPADLSEAEAIAELARLAELIAAAHRAYHERDVPIAMRHLRLDEPALARLLGVRPVTVAKYLDGRLGISKPMARLLWACDRDPSLQAALLEGDVGADHWR